jgi:hydroxymethylbilane synthase
LALAQAYGVLALCRRAFPRAAFKIRIIKTTGDKLQTASLSRLARELPKGLFTKELELALLKGEADLAVHSLKDLPTELPAGLKLGAVCERADVRDLLIYRDRGLEGRELGVASARARAPGGAGCSRGFGPGLTIRGLPEGAVVATSSTRREAQLKALRPDLRIVPIRGNVGTRLQKIRDQPGWDATVMAAAGLARLGVKRMPDGRLRLGQPPHPDVHPPPALLLSGLLASPLELDEMVPCVGQAAVGLEIRERDERLEALCRVLNHRSTWHCVTAERVFLQTMGGGCQSPVAALSWIVGRRIHLRAVSYRTQPSCRTDLSGPVSKAAALGRAAALRLLAQEQKQA